MRILYVCSSARTGGAEISLAELIVGLDRTRFVPIVLCPAGPFANLMLDKSVEVHTFDLKYLRRKSRLLTQIVHALHVLSSAPRLAMFVHRERICLVHTNGTRAQIYAGLVAKCLGLPVVWHVRDLVRPGILTGLLRRLSAIIITPSEFTKRVTDGSVRAVAHGTKVVRVYNGIDAVAFRARAESDVSSTTCSVRAEFGFESDSLLVLMVAQMVIWKGHEFFIRSAAIVARSHPQARFLVVGDDLSGYNQELLHEMECLRGILGMDGSITFAGYRTDIARIIAAADLLVVPSHNEPFGRVVLEAMCFEKPVVAFGEGGPAEIIVDGETGILAGPGNVNDLARSILLLAEDPSRRSSLGRAGRRRVERFFNAERHVVAIQNIYDGILGGQLAGPLRSIDCI